MERIAYRLTAPGIGLEVGSYAGSYQPFYQGLFMAPHTVVRQSRRPVWRRRCSKGLGLVTTPPSMEERARHYSGHSDEDPGALGGFLPGHPDGFAIDSMALPEPWAMPGYQDQVVMAAGTFVSGCIPLS